MQDETKSELHRIWDSSITTGVSDAHDGIDVGFGDDFDGHEDVTLQAIQEYSETDDDDCGDEVEGNAEGKDEESDHEIDDVMYNFNDETDVESEVGLEDYSIVSCFGMHLSNIELFSYIYLNLFRMTLCSTRRTCPCLILQYQEMFGFKICIFFGSYILCYVRLL